MVVVNDFCNIDFFITGTETATLIAVSLTSVFLALLLVASVTIILVLCVLIKRKKLYIAVHWVKDNSDLLAYRRMNTDSNTSVDDALDCEIKNRHYLHIHTKKRSGLFSFLGRYENQKLQRSKTADHDDQGKV